MKKCPNCETINGDASRFCINCKTVLEEKRAKNAYTEYEAKKEKEEEIVGKAKKFNYIWAIIDTVITILVIAYFINK